MESRKGESRSELERLETERRLQLKVKGQFTELLVTAKTVKHHYKYKYLRWLRLLTQQKLEKAYVKRQNANKSRTRLCQFYNTSVQTVLNQTDKCAADKHNMSHDLSMLVIAHLPVLKVLILGSFGVKMNIRPVLFSGKHGNMSAFADKTIGR